MYAAGGCECVSATCEHVCWKLTCTFGLCILKITCSVHYIQQCTLHYTVHSINTVYSALHSAFCTTQCILYYTVPSILHSACALVQCTRALLPCTVLLRTPNTIHCTTARIKHNAQHVSKKRHAPGHYHGRYHVCVAYRLFEHWTRASSLCGINTY